MLSSLLLGTAGFFSGSAVFYFIHRVVFHSHKTSAAYKVIFNKYNPLSPPARWGRGIHLNHHREHIQSKRRGELEELNMFFPFKVKLLVLTVMTLLFLASPPFAIGMLLFFPFYSYRHTAVHRLWNSGKEMKPWMLHHLYHHEKDPTVNHSGTIPFIDKIFGTNKKPPEEWVNKNYPNGASSSS